MVILNKHSEVIFKLLQNFFERREIMSQSAVLKCRKAPYIYELTFAVHKVYIVINFISFIDNVISLYSLSGEAVMFVFLHNCIFIKTTRSLIFTTICTTLLATLSHSPSSSVFHQTVT